VTDIDRSICKSCDCMKILSYLQDIKLS